MSRNNNHVRKSTCDYFTDFDRSVYSSSSTLSRDRKQQLNSREKKPDPKISTSIYGRRDSDTKIGTASSPRNITPYLKNRMSYSNIKPFIEPIYRNDFSFPDSSKRISRESEQKMPDDLIIDMKNATNTNDLPHFFPDINKLLDDTSDPLILKPAKENNNTEVTNTVINKEISESPSTNFTSIEEMLDKKSILKNDSSEIKDLFLQNAEINSETQIKDVLKYKNIDSNQNTIEMSDTQMKMTQTMQSLSEIIPKDPLLSNKKLTSIFPDLNVDNINASLKVMGNLQKGFKLMLKDNDRCLGVDQSNYLFSRKYKREDIELFLLHLENQISKVLNNLLTDIQKGIDIDNNISSLGEMLHNLAVANHNYDSISSVYQTDTLAYSKFTTIKNKFATLWVNFIRKMALIQKQ